MTDRVVLIGDALIDELRDDHGVREFVGGAALNVAVGLARLGVPTTLIAMVGDDEPGSRIRTYLSDYGVQLIATPSLLGSSRALSTRAGGGEPVYVFNDAAKARRIRFGDQERAAIAAAPLVAISCFPFDDAEQTEELALALAGARVAVDPNPRTDLVRDRDEFVRGFERLAARSALVKIGVDDVELLYGEPIDAVSPRLIDLGVGAVFATEGASGATIETATDAATRPISDLPGRIVDTMGAGDAAFAAVLAALVSDWPEDADAWGLVLENAMDVAAATCRFEGALLRLPTALVGPDLDRLGT